MEVRKRYCKTLFLKDDPKLISQYIDVHKPENIWPEVVAGISGVGIFEMEIYILGRQLFMIMDTYQGFDHDRDMKDLASLPRQPEWEDHVGQYQEVYPGDATGEKWVLMDKVFGLDEMPYKPAKTGQEKVIFPDYKRYCKVLKLVEDEELLKEYLKHHAPGGVWPEIIRGIREVGVIDQEIYLRDYVLFLVLDTIPDFNHDDAMEILAEKPRQAEWESFMSKYQQADETQSAGSKWTMCKQIFKLTDCLE